MVLSPEGLAEISKASDKEHPAFLYWKALGGTPFGGIDPKLAAIPVTPAMRLWLRLDQELVGGTDDGGCYFRPEALAVVLPWHREAILEWLKAFGGYPYEPPVQEAYAVARRFLRAIGGGRALARSEQLERD